MALLGISLVASSASSQVPAGGPITVSTVPTWSVPTVAADPEMGRFVVIWSKSAANGPDFIAARRYAPSGEPLGAELQISAYQSHDPSGAMGRDGSFFVAWLHRSDSIPNGEIRARFVDGDGVPRGADFRVNTSTAGRMTPPSVARLASGGFVATWASLVEPDEEQHASEAVAGQRFDRTGRPIGVEFLVTSSGDTTKAASSTAVAAGPDGSFLVVWDGGSKIQARAFTSDAQPSGPQVTVMEGFVYDQPAVTARGDQGFLVAWRDSAGRAYARVVGPLSEPYGPPFLLDDHFLGARQISVGADETGWFDAVWTIGGGGTSQPVKARRYRVEAAARGPEFIVTEYSGSYGYLRAGASSVDTVGNLGVVWADTSTGVFVQRYGGLFPSAVAVDTVATWLADGNGVLEPAETADVRTAWKNLNGSAQTIAGALGNPRGPLGGRVTVTDRSGDYGTIADGTTAPCSDCYGVAVAVRETRPALHWDVTVDESIIPDAMGQQKRWRLHVGDSFADVPRGSAAYRAVETVLHKGITDGCGPARYCPQQTASRAQAAVMVLLAKEGAGYRPAVSDPPLFRDVAQSSRFRPFIEELARRGVVTGGAHGKFGPDLDVSREEAAVLLLRTLDPALDPPACGTPVFPDVPASSPFCRWIEEMARRGIASGCGGGNFCPQAAVTREQMAAFLTATFDLRLYAP